MLTTDEDRGGTSTGAFVTVHAQVRSARYTHFTQVRSARIHQVPQVVDDCVLAVLTFVELEGFEAIAAGRGAKHQRIFSDRSRAPETQF